MAERDLVEGCGLATTSAYFEADSAELSLNAKQYLRSVAGCLQKDTMKGQTLLLVGYTDPQGTTKANRELALARIEAVAAQLEANGVERSQMEFLPAGERAATAETPEEWPYERRVDLVLRGA